MPRRSKVELSQETVQELENQFFSFLDSLNADEKRKFYSEFLTNEEKMMMYKRLALYWALFEGYSLASIQRMLGVTHDTTRLYNKKKNEMSQDFKDIVHRIGRTTEAAEHKEPTEAPVEKVEEIKMEEPMGESVKIEEQAAEPMKAEETVMEAPEMEEEKTDDKKDEETMEMKEQSEEKEPEEMRSQTELDKMQAQNEEERQAANESEENGDAEEGGEKKKKGFGRFFGF